MLEHIDQLVHAQLQEGYFSILFQDQLGEKMADIDSHGSFYKNYPVKAGTIRRLLDAGVIQHKKSPYTARKYYVLCTPLDHTRTA